MECGCLSLPYPLEQRHPKEHEFHCMLGLVSPLVFEIIPQSVMKFIGTVGKCKCVSGTSQCAMTGSCHTQRADASMFTGNHGTIYTIEMLPIRFIKFPFWGAGHWTHTTHLSRLFCHLDLSDNSGMIWFELFSSGSLRSNSMFFISNPTRSIWVCVCVCSSPFCGW